MNTLRRLQTLEQAQAAIQAETLRRIAQASDEPFSPEAAARVVEILGSAYALSPGQQASWIAELQTSEGALNIRKAWIAFRANPPDEDKQYWQYWQYWARWLGEYR